MPDPVRSAVGRLAYASRRGIDPEVTAAARRDLTAARLERHVRQVIDAVPPLTDEQKRNIAGLLLLGAS